MSWIERDNKLQKEFVFENFVQAFGFMTKVAFEAEKLNHHPEIQNLYNRVSLSLNTHDQGNVVTAVDHELAAKIDALL